MCTWLTLDVSYVIYNILRAPLIDKQCVRYCKRVALPCQIRCVTKRRFFNIINRRQTGAGSYVERGGGGRCARAYCRPGGDLYSLSFTCVSPIARGGRSLKLRRRNFATRCSRGLVFRTSVIFYVRSFRISNNTVLSR